MADPRNARPAALEWEPNPHLSGQQTAEAHGCHLVVTPIRKARGTTWELEAVAGPGKKAHVDYFRTETAAKAAAERFRQ